MPQQLQLISDNFTRANENPLSDGGKWALSPSGSDPLQVDSDVAVCSVGGAVNNGSIVTGITFANNQYANATIGSTSTPAGKEKI